MRQKGPKRIRVGIDLHPEVYGILNRYAALHRLTIGELVTHILYVTASGFAEGKEVPFIDRVAELKEPEKPRIIGV